MYARVVDDACREAGLTVSFLCADGITPWFGNDDTNDFSREFDEARRRWLREWRPDLVLVVHRWDWDDAPELGHKLRALSDELLPVARRVVLVGQPPVLRIGDATNLREYVAWRADREGALPALGPDANEPRRRRNLSVMEALVRRRPGLELLRVDDAFTLPDGSVRYAEGRRFFYADDDHLAQAGAEHVRARLAAALAAGNEAAPRAPEALARLAAKKAAHKS